MVLLGDTRVRVAGRYALAEALREEESGALYRAKDERTGQDVRVAVLRESAPEALRARFVARAEELAKIRHPNLERVLAAGVEGGRAYAVAEAVEGESLGKHLREGPTLNVEEAGRALGELLGGLDKLHQSGHAHGGLALDPPGDPLILSQARGRSVPKVTGLLFPGGLREPAKDGPAEDRRAVAALAYALLVGTLPGAKDPAPIAEARPSLKGPVATAIEKELSSDPRKRHRDTAAFQRALRTATVLARGLKDEQTERLREPSAPEEASPEGEELDEELGAVTLVEEPPFDEPAGEEPAAGRAPPPPPPPPPPPSAQALPRVPAIPMAGPPPAPPPRPEPEPAIEPEEEVAEEIDLSINEEPAPAPTPAPPAPAAPAAPRGRSRQVSEHPTIASEPPPAPALAAADAPLARAAPQGGLEPEPESRSMALWGLLGFLLFGAIGGVGAWLFLHRGAGDEGAQDESPPVATEEATPAPEGDSVPEPEGEAVAAAEPEGEGDSAPEPATDEGAPEGDSAPEPQDEGASDEGGELDEDQVRITFTHLPEDARITIDDRSIHGATATLRRTSHSRQIRVRARGYHTFRRTVPGDESMEIELEMERR